MLDDILKSVKKILFFAKGLENTKIFRKTNAKTNNFTKKSIFAKTFAKAKIFTIS
jgi:hypothetical protein